MNFFDMSRYNKPTECSKCGGELEFKGVGEYECVKCKNLEYDDYGRVRLYIDQHHRATAAEISEATGVAQREIREMLREARLEVAPDSRVMMHCEICRAPIRFGRYCQACEVKAAQQEKQKPKLEKPREKTGTALTRNKTQSGERRFQR